MHLSVAFRIWNLWKCKGSVFAQFWKKNIFSGSPLASLHDRLTFVVHHATVQHVLLDLLAVDTLPSHCRDGCLGRLAQEPCDHRSYCLGRGNGILRTKLAVISIFISQVMDENEGWGDSPRALLLPGGIKKAQRWRLLCTGHVPAENIHSSEGYARA